MRNDTVRFVSALLAVATLAAPGMAAAASTSGGMSDSKKPSFKEADANGDGAVSISEATSSGIPKSEAKGADIDRDGKLTEQDWTFVDMEATNTAS